MNPVHRTHHPCTRPLADITPPTPISGYPQTSNVQDFQVTLSASSDSAGSWAYVLLPASSPAPSSAAVLAGTDGVGATATASGSGAVAAASTPVSATITGIEAATSYKM